MPETEESLDAYKRHIRRFLFCHGLQHIFLGSCLEHISTARDQNKAIEICYQALRAKCSFPDDCDTACELEQAAKTVFSNLVDGFLHSPYAHALSTYGLYVPHGTWRQIAQLLSGDREELDSAFIQRFAGPLLISFLETHSFHRSIYRLIESVEPDKIPDLRSAACRFLMETILITDRNHAVAEKMSLHLLGFWDVFSRTGLLTRNLLPNPPEPPAPSVETQKIINELSATLPSNEELEELIQAEYYTLTYQAAEFEYDVMEGRLNV